MTRRSLLSVLVLMVSVLGLAAAPEAAQASSGLPGDGSFVTNRGRVYSVAGGALLPVLSWSALGGPRHTTAISDAQVKGANDVPRDGAFIHSLPDNRVWVVVKGVPVYVSSWAAVGGVGRYADVDGRLLNLEADSRVPLASSIRGGFVRSYSDGRIYSFAGGAPIYVTSWAAFGGPQPYVTVDSSAITRAGQGSWSFLRRYPKDYTGLMAVTVPGQPVAAYVVGGGAPIYIPTWRYLDVDTLYLDPERVDARTIEAAGGAFPYDRLRKQPVDGTFLAAGTGWDPDGPSGRTQTFWIHDGAAVPVKDQNACEPFYQNAPMAVTDISAVEKAGTGGFYDHLATLPADHPEPPC